MIALADTSRIQCFPCGQIISLRIKLFHQKWTNLESHVLDALHGGSVQVLVVLPSLNEQVGLDVRLHLLDAGHEVVVPAVHLVLPARPGGVRDAGAEILRELSHQIVIDPVLDGTEDDDGPGELEVDLLHRLVGQDLSLSSILPASYKNTELRRLLAGADYVNILI